MRAEPGYISQRPKARERPVLDRRGPGPRPEQAGGRDRPEDLVRDQDLHGAQDVGAGGAGLLASFLSSYIQFVTLRIRR